MGLQFGTYQLPGLHIPTGYCNAPTGLVASVDGDIVTFSWEKPHDCMGYQLEVFKDGAAIVNVFVDGLRYTTRLDINTAYTWTVVTVCDRVSSRDSIAAEGDVFTTGAHTLSCLPINLSDILIVPDVDSVHLSWPAVSDAVGYVLFYKVKGLLLSQDSIGLSTNSVTIKDIVPNSTYEFSIDVLCGNGGRIASETGSFLSAVSNDLCPQPQVFYVINKSAVAFAWKATGVMAFDIYMDNKLLVSNYPASLFTLSTLSQGVAHTIVIVSKCLMGNSIPGSATFTIPVQPVGLVSNIQINYLSVNVFDSVFGSVFGAGTTYNSRLTWDAPTDPVCNSTLTYKLIINGSTYNTATNYLDIVITPDTLYHVVIYTICNGISSTQGVAYEFTTPFYCRKIAVSDIKIIATGSSLTLDWPDYAGIISYSYRYKRSDSTLYSAPVALTISTFSLSGLADSIDYDIELTALCKEQYTAVTMIKGTTTGLLIGQLPMITSVDNITSNGACINFSLPDKALVGSFQLELTLLSTGVITTVNGDRTTICVNTLLPNTAYKVRVMQIKAGYTSLYSVPFTFISCPLALPVTDSSASFDNGGDIDITWQQANGASLYQIWSQDLSLLSPTWVLEGTTTTGQFTIANNNWIYKALRIDALYGSCGTASITVSIQCPKISNLKASAEGTTVNLSWDAIPGVNFYKVMIVSIAGGIVEEVSSYASYNVSGLDENTTYSIYVIPQCMPGNLGPSSDTIIVVTGLAAPDETAVCNVASFGVIAQSSLLTDLTVGTATVAVTNSATAIVNYTTYQTDTFDRYMIFKDGTNTPIDITNYHFVFNLYNSTNDIVATITDGNGITIDGANGKITMMITSTQMMTLPLGTYNYKLSWTTAGNVTKEIVIGAFIITQPA